MWNIHAETNKKSLILNIETQNKTKTIKRWENVIEEENLPTVFSNFGILKETQMRFQGKLMQETKDLGRGRRI